jgi:hypothetical protein
MEATLVALLGFVVLLVMLAKGIRSAGQPLSESSIREIEFLARIARDSGC